jgi:thiamine transport system permease protein
VAAAFTALTDGWLDWELPVLTIIAAHVFFNYSVIVRTISAAWANLDPSLEEAAATLGATRWRVLRTVTVPRLRGPIAAAAAIIFLFTFTSFGVVLILGRGAIRTLEVEMYTQTVQFLNLPLGAALAITQLVFVVAALWLYNRQKRPATPIKPAGDRQPARWSQLVPNLAVMAMLLGLPIAALIERSLKVGDGHGLGNFRRLIEADSSLPAIGNSLGFALVALMIAVITGALAAALVAYSRGRVGRGFDTLLMLPLGTSAVTIGFGFLVALDWPVDVRTSWMLVPLAHSLVALPLVVRTVAPAMRAIPNRLREASLMLGAGPWKTWRRIDLPLVWRSWLVAAGFAFAVSIGEFGATSFIARPATTTVPTLIFRLLGRAGETNYGAAMAMSVLLMILTAAMTLAIDRVRSSGVGEF